MVNCQINEEIEKNKKPSKQIRNAVVFRFRLE